VLTLIQIKNKLEDRNLKEVSKKSGVKYGTLYNIATGKNDNPSYKTLEKLSDYLKG
jgi:transcriptional regulator with XRE-family HTH domain